MLLLIVDSYYRTGLTQPNQAEAERCGIGRESVFFSLACWIVKDPDAMQGRVAVLAAALLLQLLTVTEAAQVVVIELARRDREGRDRRSGWGGRMAGSTSISPVSAGSAVEWWMWRLAKGFLAGPGLCVFLFSSSPCLLPRKCGSRSDTSRPTGARAQNHTPRGYSIPYP